MRDEIKFQAWDSSRKVMSDPFTVFQAQLFKDGKPIGLQLPEDLKVRRFTGLQDKNGREIYEGDVIDMRYDDDPADEHLYVPVVWYQGAFFLGGVLLSEDYDEVRGVVGNIYENPELLEVKK